MIPQGAALRVHIVDHLNNLFEANLKFCPMVIHIFQNLHKSCDKTRAPRPSKKTVGRSSNCKTQSTPPTECCFVTQDAELAELQCVLLFVEIHLRRRMLTLLKHEASRKTLI